MLAWGLMEGAAVGFLWGGQWGARVPSPEAQARVQLGQSPRPSHPGRESREGVPEGLWGEGGLVGALGLPGFLKSPGSRGRWLQPTFLRTSYLGLRPSGRTVTTARSSRPSSQRGSLPRGLRTSPDGVQWPLGPSVRAPIRG